MNWNTIVEYITYGNLLPDHRVEKTDEEWKAILTPQQYWITRQKGTERAHTGTLCNVFEDGKYNCVNCREPLFDSFRKFNSTSGWPCFTAPIMPSAIKFLKDKSHGMLRVETLCNTCDAHLGHVFPDGPSATGLRFCVNSEAMVLQKTIKYLSKITSNHNCIATQIPQL
ncbi:peptide-methionine (R)-S-oxide reductase MsrB [Maribacter sp. R77961]|uniref:peptide-methionine (R)-S-oxide reductase MsrB n=1 Tax=Maribacter sp. R77961 TaxID=3093871 RepID=UPI0037CA189B